MEYCFVSQKPILDIPGQVDHLQPYLLRPDDSVLLEANAVGSCYIQALAASPWAALWGARVKAHFLNTIGLVSLGEVDDLLVLQNPRSKTITVMLSNGASFDLPRLDGLLKAKRQEGKAWIELTIEYNLHDLAQPVADEIQEALRTQGDYPLARLAEHWGITDCFRQPEVLAHSKLVYNKKLKGYWDKSSTSSDCSYLLMVPEAVLDLALAPS